jgi:hypothetical protein
MQKIRYATLLAGLSLALPTLAVGPALGSSVSGTPFAAGSSFGLQQTEAGFLGVDAGASAQMGATRINDRARASVSERTNVDTARTGERRRDDAPQPRKPARYDPDHEQGVNHE